MKWFRNTLAKNRAFVLATLTVSLYGMVGGPDFAYAHQLHQQKEERLQEIADTLGIPVEKLRPDHLTLAETLGKAFGVEPEDPVKKAGLERLQKVLREHEEQLAANPYLPQIEAVKNEHAIHRIEGTLEDILQLTDPAGRKALRPQAKQAVIRNLNAAFDEGLELPPLPEGLPAKAQQRHEEMQRDLDRIVAFVRPIVKEAMDEAVLDKSSQLNPEKVVRMKQSVEGLLTRTKREPRFADRPLPLRRVEKKARVRPLRDGDRAPQASAATSAARVDAKTVATVPSKAGIAPEILALATELDNSPAKIFRFVHDNIDLDPKWGAYKGSLGTYWERSGTAWEQAWLLRDLLVAAGVDARFEWGEVEIDTDTLMNLTGVQDPWRAGDLMTTAGVPIVLLTQGSQVIKAQMQHVWVKAFVDYIPNRGLTVGPGDSWIRMDPSIKKFDYAPGIPVYEEVPFSLGDYLLSGTELSPRRAYEESLWSYIRANNIDCVTLEQLKPRASIAAAEFPYLPGTLRAKILATTAESSDMPAAFQEQVRVEVRQPSGASVLSWDVSQPDTFGQSVAIDWRGATPDDQAILDSYGGVFETPPYLVDLVPAVRLGGVDQAQGSAIGSAEDIEVVVTTTPPGGVTDVFVHQGFAGEPSVLVTSFGEVPQQLTDTFQAQLNAATQSGDEAAIERATLQMLGTTYFQNLGRDAQDIADWNWHRLLRLVSEGLVVQTGNVTTSAGGAPLTFQRAERYVDFPGFMVGLFHAQGTAGFVKPTLELAGAQGSFLEGQVFDQVVASEGIAAVSALTRAQREGQALTLVDSSNVDAVLSAVGLSDEIENQVRQAVGQGQIAWIPESQLGVNSWQGVGFVLEDPSTGAAAYLLNGGFAGGADTGELIQQGMEVLGEEPWLNKTPAGLLISGFLEIIQLAAPTNDPTTNHGDPVNLSSGNLWRVEQDLMLQAKGFPVVLSRTYNSRSNRSDAYGLGWSFSFGESLTPSPDGSILFREFDGSEHTFTPADAGGFDSPPGKKLDLTVTALGWKVESGGGLARTFDSEGRMTQIATRSGNALTVAYDPDGLPTSVVDAAGRVALTFSGSAGKITEVEDLSGRKVSYEYDGDHLIRVSKTSGDVVVYAYDEDGNLISRTSPGGLTDTYDYDSEDRCIGHVDRQGNKETFSYGRRSRAATVTNVRGFTSFREFDSQGRATLAVDPLGNATSSTWSDGFDRLTTTSTTEGTTTRTYDDRGNVLTETDPLGNTTTLTWDPNYDLPLTVSDSSGYSVTNTWDSSGNLVSQAEVRSGEVVERTFEYDSDGLLIESTGPEGDVTTRTWNPTNGMVESFTDGAGNTTELTTDDVGQLLTVEAPGGVQMSATWGESGRIETLSDAFGNETTIVYDPEGMPIEVHSDRGVVKNEYDALGNQTARIGVLLDTVRSEYDSAGNLVASIDEQGNRTTYLYDPLARLSAMVDAQGGVWTFGHCGARGAGVGGGGSCSGGGCGSASGADENFCEITDPLGNSTRQEHDSQGRLVKVIDPLGNETSFEYDDTSRTVTSTDALNRQTVHEFDEIGQLLAVEDSLGNRTTYEFDKLGNLISTIDPTGSEWARTYSSQDQTETHVDPLGAVTQYFFGSLGNISKVIRPDGEEINYTYDVGRLTEVLLPDGQKETFGFDQLGNLISMSNSESNEVYEYDSSGRLVSVENITLGETLAFSYFENGNVKSMVGPAGEVRYFYNASGQLVEQHDPAVGTFGFQYDALGRRTAVDYPNGSRTQYSYDAASRLESVISRNALGEVFDGFTYTYDAVGNRLSSRSLSPAGGLHTYEYDELNRLDRWDSDSGRYQDFAYDAVGNRLAMDDEVGTVSYSYDAAHQLLSETRDRISGSQSNTGYEWDLNGNLTRKTQDGQETNYNYNALGRLTSVVGPAFSHQYGYRPDGLRVRRTTGGATEKFLLAPKSEARRGSGDEMNVAFIVGAFDETGSLSQYYSHGPMVDEPLAESAGGTVSYFHKDGLGSVTSVTRSSGSIVGSTRYEPFGVSSSPLDTRFGFTGREADPEGLMYYRSRHYDPDLGRFLTRDSLAPTVGAPATINPYSYAWNDPVNLTDPDGHKPKPLGVELGALYSGMVVLAILLMVVAAVICEFSGVSRDCVAAVATLFASTPFIVSVIIAIFLTLLGVYGAFTDGSIDNTTAMIYSFYLVLAATTALLIEFSLGKGLGDSVKGKIGTGLILVGSLIAIGELLKKGLETLQRRNK